jgi:hypothetical protein
MIPVRNILTSAILGLSLSIAGCQNDGHGNTNTAGQVSQAQLPPPKTMNQVSAQEKLKEAEQAETEGKFAHALECYEQLRSYPEAARPKDLDERIKRVEVKAKSQQ